MSKPLVVTVSHHLGKEEAVRRLKSGLGSVRSNFSHLLTVEEETWTENHFDFRVRALGQVVSGSIDVQEDRVVLQFVLPWLLAQSRRRDPAAYSQGRHADAGEEVIL